MNLDELLHPGMAANWLGVSFRWLAEDARQVNPKVPVFRMSQKTVRYHPRTILAMLAQRAGVPVDVIAASYGQQERKETQ